VFVKEDEGEDIVFVGFDQEVLFFEPVRNQRPRLTALDVEVRLLYNGKRTREIPVAFASSNSRVIYILYHTIIGNNFIQLRTLINGTHKPNNSP